MFALYVDGRFLALLTSEQRDDLSYLDGLRGVEFAPVSAHSSGTYDDDSLKDSDVSAMPCLTGAVH